jgi:hypothetical protein
MLAVRLPEHRYIYFGLALHYAVNVFLFFV